jgi:hypothetical protein
MSYKRKQQIKTKWFGVRTPDGSTKWGAGVPVGYTRTERVYLAEYPDNPDGIDFWAETGMHFLDKKYTDNGRHSSLWCPNPSVCLLCKRKAELSKNDGWVIPARKRRYYYQLWSMDDDWSYDEVTTQADRAHLSEDGNMWPMVWCPPHSGHMGIQGAIMEYEELTKPWAASMDGEWGLTKQDRGVPLEITVTKHDNSANGIEYNVSLWQPPGSKRFTYYPLPEKWQGHPAWNLERFKHQPALERQIKALERFGVGTGSLAKAPVAPKECAFTPEPARELTPQTHTIPVPPKPPAPPSGLMKPPAPPPAPVAAKQPEPVSKRRIPSSLMVAPIPAPVLPQAAPEPVPAPQPMPVVNKPPQGDKQSAADMYRKLFSQGRQ